MSVKGVAGELHVPTHHSHVAPAMLSLDNEYFIVNFVCLSQIHLVLCKILLRGPPEMLLLGLD